MSAGPGTGEIGEDQPPCRDRVEGERGEDEGMGQVGDEHEEERRVMRDISSRWHWARVTWHIFWRHCLVSRSLFSTSTNQVIHGGLTAIKV